jgi:antibiotic biosynthesis monooxygenase (ABM) superfamily enzyme
MDPENGRVFDIIIVLVALPTNHKWVITPAINGIPLSKWVITTAIIEIPLSKWVITPAIIEISS